MINTPTITTPTTPKLWDWAIAELQTELEANISWLTVAFGKASRKVRSKDGRDIRYPAVFTSGGDYLSMFPDGHIGNYSWIDVRDYQEFTSEDRRQEQYLSSEIGLVFWLDLQSAYPADYTLRTIEHAKNDVIVALQNIKLTRSVLSVDRVAEWAENIYRGYTYNEIESQFLMFPYTGFRFEGEMTMNPQCP